MEYPIRAYFIHKCQGMMEDIASHNADKHNPYTTDKSNPGNDILYFFVDSKKSLPHNFTPSVFFGDICREAHILPADIQSILLVCFPKFGNGINPFAGDILFHDRLPQCLQFCDLLIRRFVKITAALNQFNGGSTGLVCFSLAISSPSSITFCNASG